MQIVDHSQSECYNIVSINENEKDNNVYIYHYPNPVKEYAIFKYYSEQMSKLTIYNLTGRIIRSYDQLKPGTNSIRWLSADKSGRDLSDGLYFYVFETGKERITGKVQIVN